VRSRSISAHPGSSGEDEAASVSTGASRMSLHGSAKPSPMTGPVTVGPVTVGPVTVGRSLRARGIGERGERAVEPRALPPEAARRATSGQASARGQGSGRRGSGRSGRARRRRASYPVARAGRGLRGRQTDDPGLRQIPRRAVAAPGQALRNGFDDGAAGRAFTPTTVITSSPLQAGELTPLITAPARREAGSKASAPRRGKRESTRERHRSLPFTRPREARGDLKPPTPAEASDA
jgi:hypothetical protein